MARRRTTRRLSGKADGGSSWISYSDMMAALLLVFVLILCYSLYQYFSMLETKTAELDAQAALLSQQQTTLDEQKATLAKQQSTLSNQQTTLENQQKELATQQQTLQTKETELTAALSQLEEQQGVLSQQELTLEEQQKLLLAAQAALSEKETALNQANLDLETQQKALQNATILLGQQQEAMDNQQKRLDDLVGVRTKIVRELTTALTTADLKASVDANTGDIVLESAVFFDYAKHTIKEAGAAFLDEFIPIYLGVLLEPEYEDYLGEIIIEGHTDTNGDYLFNLELSQERALSVATYCLKMPTLTKEQVERLREILTAKGRSESDPVYNADGTVNEEASRRVEFKFRMKDAEMIDEIRSILSADDGQ